MNEKPFYSERKARGAMVGLRRTISTKLAGNQHDELLAYLEQFHPDLQLSDYIRMVITREMASNGVEWSQEDFVSNRERTARAKRGKDGIPWKPHEARWGTPNE